MEKDQINQNYYQVLNSLKLEIVESGKSDLEVVLRKTKKSKKAKNKGSSESGITNHITNPDASEENEDYNREFVQKLNLAVKSNNIPVILALMENKNFYQQKQIIKLMSANKAALETIESKNEAREKKEKCMRIAQVAITLVIIGILEAIIKLTPPA